MNIQGTALFSCRDDVNAAKVFEWGSEGVGRVGQETPMKRQPLSARPSTASSSSARRWYGKQRRPRAKAVAPSEELPQTSPVMMFPSLAPSHAPMSGRMPPPTVHCSARAPPQKTHPVERLPASEVAWRTRIARLGLSPLSGFSPEQVLAPLAAGQSRTTQQPPHGAQQGPSKRRGSPR